MDWSWAQIAPFYQDLEARPLDERTVDAWLRDWTLISDLIGERYARLNVSVTTDTTDTEAEARLNAFLDVILTNVRTADQKLKQKLLASRLQPEGFAVPLRKMQTEADLFREANLPLLSEERKLGAQYNKIIGAQTVQWQGEELTLQQVRPLYQTPDREQRERLWRLAAERQLQDRPQINDLWGQMLGLRQRLAANAGLPDYRTYRWRQMLRLDYTPDDSRRFQEAVAEVAVPAAIRVYERHCRRLGVESLRPWDLDQDLYPIHLPPLPTYGGVEALHSSTERIFYQVEPKLGEYYHTLRSEGLLDLDNRKGKAPGGYCTYFPVARRPFIFMNAVGLTGDVRTMLHESGHAFHNFERARLPYAWQRNPGLEFSEVASMAMELLAAPYLPESRGGFYSEADASRFLAAHLEHILIFWPYMAVVDSFQHWVYEHPDQAADPDRCDARWLELWQRYIPGVDWSGLEAEAMTGWHRKLHIFQAPFYYIEYGLAQMGAVLVWRNALQDQAAALRDYLSALALGGTVPLPELYAAAGARFAFDAGTLGEAVSLVEKTLSTL